MPSAAMLDAPRPTPQTLKNCRRFMSIEVLLIQARQTVLALSGATASVACVRLTSRCATASNPSQRGEIGNVCPPLLLTCGPFPFPVCGIMPAPRCLEFAMHPWWLLALPFIAGSLMPLQAGINGQVARQLSSVMAAALL